MSLPDQDVRYTMSFLLWWLTAIGVLAIVVSTGVYSEAAFDAWVQTTLTDSDRLALGTAIVIAAALLTWVVVATGWLERITARRRRLHKKKLNVRVPIYRTGTTVSEMMAVAYEKRSARSMTILLLTFVFSLAIVWFDRTTSSIITSLITGVLYLCAVLRQAILRMRVAKHYFGNTEHEVRQLLWFVLQHADPSDFSSSGNARSALDVEKTALSTSSDVVKVN